MALVQTDASDFLELSTKLKAASRGVRTRMRRRLREIAKPLGEEVREAGSAPMPQSGGLGSNLRSSTLKVSAITTGMLIGLGGKAHRGGEGQLAQIDGTGTLRHPVYADASADRKTWGWATQRVPARTYTGAFMQQRGEVREDLARELHAILEELS